MDANVRVRHVGRRHLEHVRGGRHRRGADPARIGEVRLAHAQAGCRRVHLCDEGRDAAGVPPGQEVGVVVRRVHEQAADDLALGQLLAQRDLCVGVVVDGVAVVVVDVGLGHGDRGAGIARSQRVVVQHDVGRHELGQARHRRRLLGCRRHADADGRDGDGSLARGRPRERDRVPGDADGPGQHGGHHRRRVRGARPHAHDDGARRDQHEQRREQHQAAGRVPPSVRVHDMAPPFWGRRGRRRRVSQRVEPERRHHQRRRTVLAHLRLSASSSSGVMSTARALEPSLGPTTPACSKQVHQAAGPGEADAQLALEHGGGAELGAHHEVPGLHQQLVVVVVDAGTAHRAVLDAVDPHDGLGLAPLGTPVADDLAHLLLRDPGGLETARDVGRGGEQQHVPLADQALGAGLVQDHPAVGQRGDREGHAARDVGLDDPGDDVDRGPLGGDHQVDADGARHLGDAHDGVLDVAGRHHHQVVQLVDDDEDEGQRLGRLGLVVDLALVVDGRMVLAQGPGGGVTRPAPGPTVAAGARSPSATSWL